MPVINNQANLLYDHDLRMIGSYQLLLERIKKWRYDLSNKKYRNNVFSDTDTHTTNTALFSVAEDFWTFQGLFMIYIINQGTDQFNVLSKKD